MRSISSAAIVAVPALFLSLLTGCGGSAGLGTGSTSAAVTGNWRLAAQAQPASQSQVAAFTGSLQVIQAGGGALPSTVQGVVHAVALPSQQASTLCVSPTVAIPLTGSTAADGTLTLTSSKFANGGVLTVRGSYDAASRTLKAAQIGVAGGSCGFAVQPAIAAQYQPIQGTYTGTFTSTGGSNLGVSAQLTQTSAPDPNGNYSLQGSATFAANPCLGSTVVTSSTVSGGTVSFQYTDSTTGAAVSASGTYDPNAGTLTIGSYTLTGNTQACSDTGTGVLQHQ
ncbi:hypothetical protein [Terriglobus aquaticus]|uniref:Lipoprotein n=1 Tax=Terriglobus aquaticus TaxID=940139 RepID=A0ABW9KF34_9BACT|nr:hypothetical protein [Terriglobus aquaticus]